MPEAIPYYEDATRITGQAASGGLIGCRLATVTLPRPSGPAIPATAQIGASDPVDGGNIIIGYPTAGQHALGVVTWDAAAGEKVTLLRVGVVPLYAAANITAGQRVQVAATGQVTPYVTAGALPDNVVVGIAVDTFTATNIGGVALLTQ